MDPESVTHAGLLQAPVDAQDSATLEKHERMGHRAQVVLAPGLVTSGKETGTAVEGWENAGYFPSLGAELRLGCFLF